MGREALTCRGSGTSQLDFEVGTYTVTSLEVSNWRLLFTPAMMMSTAEQERSNCLFAKNEGGDDTQKTQNLANLQSQLELPGKEAGSRLRQ